MKKQLLLLFALGLGLSSQKTQTMIDINNIFQPVTGSWAGDFLAGAGLLTGGMSAYYYNANTLKRQKDELRLAWEGVANGTLKPGIEVGDYKTVGNYRIYKGPLGTQSVVTADGTHLSLTQALQHMERNYKSNALYSTLSIGTAVTGAFMAARPAIPAAIIGLLILSKPSIVLGR